MRLLVTLPFFFSLLPSLPLCAADKDKNFEGIIGVTEMRGGVSTQTIYTRKGDQLRIENPDKSKPEPINIIDLAGKKLTIVYPHNSSFAVVDLTKTPAQPGNPNLPPGFPAPPDMNSSAVAGVGDPGGRMPGASMQVGSGSAIPATVGPAISPPPGFPAPPPMPSMPPRPQMPNGEPPIGAGGVRAGLAQPALPNQMMPPMMPPMPAMGGFGAAAPELKKTDKTRKIQGFECTLYTISDRMQTFEIWATPDSGLFPFRVIQMNYQSRRFGPRMLEEQWVELLQKQSLFPLEATLRAESRILPLTRAGTSPAPNSGSNPGAPDPGPPQLTFKVDKIEKKKIDDDKLFQPPEGYYEIQTPRF